MKLKSFAELAEAMKSASPSFDTNPFCAFEPWDAHGVIYSKGWFFFDEAYDIHSPYATEEKACEGLTAYCQNELGEKP